MIGFISGAISIAKHAKHIGKVVPVVRALAESKSDIEVLFYDGLHKWDTDGDGKPDITAEEALDFLVKLLQVVIKRMN